MVAGVRHEDVALRVGRDALGAPELADVAERTPVTLAIKAGLAIDTRLAAEDGA